MPTTKKLGFQKFVIAVTSLALLGLATWNYGFELADQIRPGLCQFQGANGIEVITREAALDKFETAMTTAKPLKKQSLSCAYWPSANQGSLKLNSVGLTAQAQAVVDASEIAFGYIPKGGYEPGGVSSGHIQGSAHYEGRAVDFFFRPHTKKPNRRAGWQLAIWASLHAAELNIETVIFDDHIWTRLRSSEGWRPYTHPSGDTTNPILRHLDHVHIDVN